MKHIFAILSLIVAAFGVCAQPANADQWWSYLASYDKGPGSILVNLALRKTAPQSAYASLITVVTSYSSDGRQGLPTESDLERLSSIEEAVESAVEARSPAVRAGTFTYDYEQRVYLYVKNPSGVREDIAKVYAEKCPSCKMSIEIKQDPAWLAYLDFLFPNGATREFYGLRLD